MAYFSDRHQGPPPRVVAEIPDAVAAGIVGFIRNRANDGWLGMEYPEQCPDGRGTTGTDIGALQEALGAHRLYNILERNDQRPTTLELLDLIEFTYEKVAEPERTGHHEYFGHYHLVFNQEQGRAKFRAEINRIFERNGIAFELQENGEVQRLAPEVLS